MSRSLSLLLVPHATQWLMLHSQLALGPGLAAVHSGPGLALRTGTQASTVS